MNFTHADFEGNTQLPYAKARYYRCSGERLDLIMTLFWCLANTIVGGGGLVNYACDIKLMMKLKIRGLVRE